MTLLQRVWLAITGKHIPNPKEQALRTHAGRVAAVAHTRAAEIRGDRLRADYRRADEAMCR